MNRDEAMMRLCAAFGVDPALADFNIVAVNCVLDSLEAAEREAKESEPGEGHRFLQNMSGRLTRNL